MNPIFYTLLLLLIVGGIVAFGFYLNSTVIITITEADYIEAAKRQHVSLEDVNWGSNCHCPLAIAAERAFKRPVYVTISGIHDERGNHTIGMLKKPFTWSEFYYGKKRVLSGMQFNFTSKVHLTTAAPWKFY